MGDREGRVKKCWAVRLVDQGMTRHTGHSVVKGKMDSADRLVCWNRAGCTAYLEDQRTMNYVVNLAGRRTIEIGYQVGRRRTGSLVQLEGQGKTGYADCQAKTSRTGSVDQDCFASHSSLDRKGMPLACFDLFDHIGNSHRILEG